MHDEIDWPDEQPTLAPKGGLSLRPWQGADADAVFRACQDADIQRFTTVPVPYLLEHAQHFVAVVCPANYRQRVAAGFAVADAANGDLLGACGLAAVDLDHRTSGAGYWVAPWARGRGVAAKALRALAAWALEPGRLRRIQMEIEPINAASVAAAVRAGFVKMDTQPLMEMHRGQVRPFDLYERLGSE